MAKNDLAKKIVAAQVAAANAIRRALVCRVIDTYWMAIAVALNRQSDHWGRIRIARLKDDVTDILVNEYGIMLKDVDADYADGKLKEAYHKIMQEGE